MHPIQFGVSILLFFILFFGLFFLVNMILKTTWIPGVVIYLIVVVSFVSDVSWGSLFLSPLESLQAFGSRLTELLVVDYVVLSAGLVGVLASGYAIQLLRSKGYRMF